MANKDNIAAAELAALVGGRLNEIDQKRLDGPPALQTHPRDFLPKQPQQIVQTTNNSVIPQQSIIEAPKSKPAGSQVVGTESVNLQNLMIPMDGADPKMREAIAKYSNSNGNIQPQPQPQVAPPQPPPQPIAPAQQPTNEIIELLKNIDHKLDLLLKRAKIKPRYKDKK